MATECPGMVEVQHIQFKLHDKFALFGGTGGQIINNVELLAVASSCGLVFAGAPDAAVFKVMMHRNLVDARDGGGPLLVRTVSLPGPPHALACNADGTMLAVNCADQGQGILLVYKVDSFLQPQVQLLFCLPLTGESGEPPLTAQLLWNPVVATNLALVLHNGAITMYTFKDAGRYDIRTQGKESGAMCGCWSPKGKQIVFGFANGKFIQFKPDLTPARTIACPPGIVPGQFKTIALQWLATYQFATVFEPLDESLPPSLFIVNAPKVGVPEYVNYFDICYSQSGPRRHQFTFIFVQAWQLLLVTSANGFELGVLGTSEQGEMPKWQQFGLLDEARIELPLTADKEETFPVGFVLDTASSHNLPMGDGHLPVMPIVHLLSTHGDLVTFNFLNLAQGAADICSPPPPLADKSGQFQALEAVVEEAPEERQAPTPTPTPTPLGGNAENTFNFSSQAVTSTPAQKEKPAPPSSFFANLGAPTMGGVSPFSFTAPAQLPPAAPSSAVSFSFAPPPETANVGNGIKPAEVVQKPVEVNHKPPEVLCKPLYTVPPVFAPGDGNEADQKTSNVNSNREVEELATQIDDALGMIMEYEVRAFDEEMAAMVEVEDVLVEIGRPDTMRPYSRRLHNLMDLVAEAKNPELRHDVRNLRYALNETYAMIIECRNKLALYQKPDIPSLVHVSRGDPIRRRHLARLKGVAAVNELTLNQIQMHLDLQWTHFDALQRRKSRSQMRLPSLDVVYQRMGRVQELIARRRTTIEQLKHRLKDMNVQLRPVPISLAHQLRLNRRGKIEMDSLTSRLINVTLGRSIDVRRAKLTDEKLDVLRKFTVQHNHISIVRPQRPDRPGLDSEVVLEMKLRCSQQRAREREGAVTSLDKMQQETLVQNTKGTSTATLRADTAPPPSAAAPLAKPTATKAPAPLPAPFASLAASFASTAATAAAPSFSFGGTSPFVKPAAAPLEPKAPESAAVKTPLMQTPISFAAKVIDGGNTAKPAISAAPIGGGFTALSAGGASKENKKPDDSNRKLTAPATTAMPATAVSFFGASMPTATSTPAPLKPLAFDGKGNFAFTLSKSTPLTFGTAPLPSFGPKPATTAATTAAAEPPKAASTKPQPKPLLPPAQAPEVKAPPAEKAKDTPTVLSAAVTPAPDPSEILGGLNICKPTTKAGGTAADASKAPPSNIFAGLGGASTGGNIFAAISSSAGIDFSSSPFAALNLSTAATGDAGKTTTAPTPATTTAAAAVPATTAAAAATTAATMPAFSFTGAAGAKSWTAPFSLKLPTATTFEAPSTATTTTTTAAAAVPSTAAPPAASVFSSPFTATSTVAPAVTSTTAATTTATSLFKTSPTVTGANIFGGIAKPEATTPVAGPNQNATSITSGGNLFAGLGGTPHVVSGAFGAFGGGGATTPSEGGSIFDGTRAYGVTPAPAFGSPVNGTASNTSLFAAATPSASAGVLPFGDAKAPTTVASGNLFSTPTVNANSSGGSLFASSGFGQTSPAASTTNLFGGGAAAPASAFSGSMFGGGGNSSGGGGSNIFGGGSSSAASPGAASGAFGGFAQSPGGAFGSPTGGGTFAQGGASVAQSGFGSPPAAQTSAFAKPIFGGAPTFGSSPSFGSPPTFGGVPAFGGFGAYSSPAAATPATGGFQQAAQKNNLFETLGATDAGLSFGNLAQSTQAPNAQKISFGGSSFMNYRT